MIPFVKMEAVGNDFIVVDARVAPDLSALAARLCTRRTGVGADGLLTFTPHPDGLHFGIYNADGSEDTMCGNGLRCVVRWAVDQQLAPPSGIAWTRVGAVPYQRERDDVTLTLAAPHFWETSLPGTQTVDTGSLHTVVWPAVLPDDSLFVRESSAWETHPFFPERTSVMWTVMTGPNQLRLRIWERGVGETLGCGTGACAAAVVAIAQGRCLASAPVQVASAGGTLSVHWAGAPDSPVILSGPARVVFTGQVA